MSQADDHHERATTALSDFWADLNAPIPAPPELPRQRLQVAYVEALLAIDARIKEATAEIASQVGG